VTSRAGFTLIEVVVSLALLALILGVSAVGLASLREPPTSAVSRQQAAARDSAIRAGTLVVAAHVLFLPDGRAIGPGVDALTGAPRAQR
jgi:prepilin-type N-terminal cleavage/methylation domain-containing protein